ncbi:hypothetical protein TBLA_0E04190 [Henningerozyma blattae CBS 6284]|uniref:Phospholipid-transporting ATPase n=1 Tax=Henningerozyma blattae (strain ATCC 34711 / CBS 6284 / DSM 70876 / NBRC 10599 / NRRL Y-10934 / UCD 77-7) TaxID=1071380 RepID=I2H521_HENB6|nr:hypothetical protein TBLA_0E04190 [Tetrapisispora blattae CBS 6284]CCH61473.1 hypothetical protein TBLA_0E04190 [Tetrapisispora blattae CBS 6284]
MSNNYNPSNIGYFNYSDNKDNNNKTNRANSNTPPPSFQDFDPTNPSHNVDDLQSPLQLLNGDHIDEKKPNDGTTTNTRNIFEDIELNNEIEDFNDTALGHNHLDDTGTSYGSPISNSSTILGSPASHLKNKFKFTNNHSKSDSSGSKSNDTNINSKKKKSNTKNKTLKWAKKNLYDTFEEFNMHHDTTIEDDMKKNRSAELRSIYFNLSLPESMLDEEGNPATIYPRNKIRTTKYTPLSFIPKNLIFQFKNFANIYFLCLIILGAFQIFGVTNPGFAAVPLIVIVCITAIKDGFEDSRRTVLDMKVNNTKTHIFEGITNENVSVDNVSWWRKFKKANTRLLFKFINWVSQYTTAEGKRKRLEKKLQRQRRKRNQINGNFHGSRRSSISSSLSSVRISDDFDEENGFYDYDENDGSFIYDDTNFNIIDKSLPPRQDVKFQKDYWKNIKVGDVIRIHNNDEIPADVVLLSTSDVDGNCYVETKNLDGETNLKIRQALKCSYKIKNSHDVARTKFWIESEGPNPNLYTYQGNLKWNDSMENEVKNEPITINEVLLRGCTLRNTKWAMGIVVFTGDDTKIMLNSGTTPTKKSRISRELNLSVLINFLLLFILCFISGVVNGVNYDRHPRSRDFFEFGTVAGNAATNGFVSFWVAVILYQSLVPISLYISIEIIKTAQAAFIYGDVLLYNAKLDYPCTPKSWNISDDLGQIEYIFSDKTGTLTQNIMEFKKCTINGVSYGRAYTEALAGLRKREGIDVETEQREEKIQIAQDREVMINELRGMSANSQFWPDDITFVSKKFVRDLNGHSGDFQQNCCQHFFLAIALCHTVLTEASKTNPDKLELKAQSPDEAALVGTARDMGFSFISKTKHGVVIELMGQQREFEILNVLEFNSSRKRMSVIVKIPAQDPDGTPTALLICKGADSVIFQRLSTVAGSNDEKLLENTAKHLEEYAKEGLRTLCIAQREISWQEYLDWKVQYDEAASSLNNREEQIEIASNAIEKDLILLGGTAIEDRLQDGVPESIELLGKAGIKLWVLTGDKVETAINIGFSCNLLNNDMELLIIKAVGDSNIKREFGDEPFEITEGYIRKYLREKFGMNGSVDELEIAKKQHDVPKENYGVVIDGEALKLALSNEGIKREFLLLCKNCKAVLCCRVSPSQKAAVVKLVKNTLDVMTLAIGDGSNDVAMIQSADVGVGIAGEEGRQAVMCSDYAIGQFRYLSRLILVHGRWSYKRLSEMIPGFFYKNVIFTLALFWYGIYNDFDGSYLFEYTFLTFYNLAFTSLPIILLGVFDQDVSDTISMVMPQLYRVGILRLEWKQTKFLWYMLDGFYQSVISFFFPYCLYYKTMIVRKDGLGLDHRYYVGTMITCICVVSCNLYILMHQYHWDWFCGLFFSLSILLFFFWTGIWTSSITSGEFLKGGAHVFSSDVFWGIVFVSVMFCLLPRFSYDTIQRIFYPKDVEIVREMWKRGDFDHYPQGYDPTDPLRPRITKHLHSYGYDYESGLNKASRHGGGIDMNRSESMDGFRGEDMDGRFESIEMDRLTPVESLHTNVPLDKDRKEKPPGGRSGIQLMGSPRETEDLLYSERLGGYMGTDSPLGIGHDDKKDNNRVDVRSIHETTSLERSRTMKLGDASTNPFLNQVDGADLADWKI